MIRKQSSDFRDSFSISAFLPKYMGVNREKAVLKGKVEKCH